MIWKTFSYAIENISAVNGGDGDKSFAEAKPAMDLGRAFFSISEHSHCGVWMFEEARDNRQSAGAFLASSLLCTDLKKLTAGTDFSSRSFCLLMIHAITYQFPH